MASLGRGISSVVQTARNGQSLSLPSIRVGFTADLVERFSSSACREEEASASARSSASVDLVMQEQASCSSSTVPLSETFGRQPDLSPTAKSLDQNPALGQSSIPFSSRQFWTSTFRQAASQAQPLGNGRRAYLVDTLALVSAIHLLELPDDICKVLRSRTSSKVYQVLVFDWGTCTTIHSLQCCGKECQGIDHHVIEQGFERDAFRSSFQVRRLESEGLTAKQAEAITHVITEVLSDSLENVAQNFTSKVEMQKVRAD